MKQLPRSTGVLVIAFLLALPAAASPPREVRMHGPNGDGGTCPEAVADDDADAAPAPQAHRRASSAGEKAKATPMMRSGDGGGSARPRWHSILPGMFR